MNDTQPPTEGELKARLPFWVVKDDTIWSKKPEPGFFKVKGFSGLRTDLSGRAVPLMRGDVYVYLDDIHPGNKIILADGTAVDFDDVETLSQVTERLTNLARPDRMYGAANSVTGDSGNSPRPDDFDYWGNHESYPVDDWQWEVAEGNTRQGYWEWARQQQDDERDLGSDSQEPASMPDEEPTTEGAGLGPREG